MDYGLIEWCNGLRTYDIIYMLFLLNIRIDICIQHSPNPIHTVFDIHYSYP
jgi:hypothetical protein